jgi:hypothetical protein
MGEETEEERRATETSGFLHYFTCWLSFALLMRFFCFLLHRYLSLSLYFLAIAFAFAFAFAFLFLALLCFYFPFTFPLLSLYFLFTFPLLSLYFPFTFPLLSLYFPSTYLLQTSSIDRQSDGAGSSHDASRAGIDRAKGNKGFRPSDGR